MDIDDNDDDFYAPEEPAAPAAPAAQPDGAATTANAPAETEPKPDQDEDLEEGEEEDEGGAMDEDDSSDDVSMNTALDLLLAQHRVIRLMLLPQSMVIITERKDGTSAGPPSSVPAPCRVCQPVSPSDLSHQTIPIQQHQGYPPAINIQRYRNESTSKETRLACRPETKQRRRPPRRQDLHPGHQCHPHPQAHRQALDTSQHRRGPGRARQTMAEARHRSVRLLQLWTR